MAFPELCGPAITKLKAFAKETPVGQYRKLATQTAAHLARNVTWCVCPTAAAARSSIMGEPRKDDDDSLSVGRSVSRVYMRVAMGGSVVGVDGDGR